MKLNLLYFLVASSLVSLASAARWCDRSNQICVIGNADETGRNVEFTIYSKYAGWVGIGLGGNNDGMREADMYLGWRSSSGGAAVTYRIGTAGHPKATTNENGFSGIPLISDKSLTGFTTKFSFKRPFTSPGGKSIRKSTTTTFIYAASDSAVSASRDTPSLSLDMHKIYGTFNADFSSISDKQVTGGEESGEAPILSNINRQTVLLIHGIAMVIAWGVSPFIGVFIARYLKGPLGVWWFRLHIFFMLILTTVLTTGSSIFVFLYSSGPHFDDPHKIIGLAIFGMTLAQVTLGFISDVMWSPDRNAIPWWDKLHWWLGRILMVAGIANCQIGLTAFEASISFIAAFWVLVGLGIFSLVFGQFKWGQVHHMNGDYSGKGQGHDEETYNPYSTRD